MGVDHVCLIDRKKDFSEQLQAYLTQHACPYFDHVIDPFMDIYLPKLLPFVRRFGSYISCGVARQSPHARLEGFVSDELSIEEVFSTLLRKSIHFIGNNLGTSADLQEALDDLSAGRLTVELAEAFSHEDTLKNFVQSSLNSQGRFGKVIFRYPPAATQ
ncbi:hypothetical protein CS022_21330 [Veronia nyctiphanis]|uniref:Alcohol dehydrogenase n=1 Tax=Veronia nyctiphanis TaxID=1278244 RepID=A0A4Q0YQA7_9GAMM|nr:hypothetical protein [Veronia nyctiphanis]RXJ71211.1 hypothetical protein CS022_21330 [Veronia nyctiphanis]